MAEVIAKLRVEGKSFEILVDCDKAMDFREGKAGISDVVVSEGVYTDIKKGLHASESDLEKAFGSTDVMEIGAEIVNRGEVQLTAEYRKKIIDARRKQVVDFLARNCMDPKTRLPHPPQRIENALEEVGVRIDDKPVDAQVQRVIKELQSVLPISMESKKIAVKIPAAYTGKAFGIVKDYAGKEEWQADGSLVCLIELPAGLQDELFEKLNELTHGAVEIKDIE